MHVECPLHLSLYDLHSENIVLHLNVCVFVMSPMSPSNSCTFPLSGSLREFDVQSATR